MKKRILKFETKEPFIPDIQPVKNFIPKWYKDSKNITDNKITYPLVYSGLKTCIPFLDSLTTGYIIPCVGDIVVSKDRVRNDFIINTRKHTDFLTERDPAVSGNLPIPHGHIPRHFAWNLSTAIQVDDGYSLLITHPFNRFDLPFTTLTGIVDANFALYGGNIPFFFKEGFEGIIESGTPIAQIIPIKRESWQLVKEEGLYAKSEINNKKRGLKVSGWYKHNFWNKKEYN